MENGDLDTGNIEGKNMVLVVNLWGGGRFMEEGYSGQQLSMTSKTGDGDGERVSIVDCVGVR